MNYTKQARVVLQVSNMAKNFFFNFLLLCASLISLNITMTISAPTSTYKNRSFFIFGDSSVDPGNNNYIKTIPENKANYKPYGEDFYSHIPTGRFTNGRILVDFLSQYAKLPLIPPFLQPSADFSHGVNFASGGAGILTETNKGLAIDLKTQLKHFKEARKILTAKLGYTEGQNLISEGVYLFSFGANDLLGNYLRNPKTRELYPPEQFLGMMVGNLTQAIHELYSKGGRKFGLIALPPLGCAPILRASNPEPNKSVCFELANDLAIAHNKALKSALISLQNQLKYFKYGQSEFYQWTLDIIENPSKYGLKEGVNACCGTGPFRGVYTCGGKKKITEYELCDDPNEHVWWDSIHPSETIHKKYAKALWHGKPSLVGPYNLKDLFLH